MGEREREREREICTFSLKYALRSYLFADYPNTWNIVGTALRRCFPPSLLIIIISHTLSHQSISAQTIDISPGEKASFTWTTKQETRRRRRTNSTE